jgi:Concanavalin A-like lectin/glucanases superfamily
VGAWSFDEAAGKTVADASGNANTGTVSGASRVTGRYGKALSFDGVNDMVTVADAASLDLTKAMTVEAWVKPSALGSMWRSVVVKEQASHLSYALYAGNGSSRSSGHVNTGGDNAVAGPTLTLNRWTHLATTWNGSTLSVWVDGKQVASKALTGTAAVSSRALRFGGNTIWNEWFKGQMDDVRIYNRALGATEIAADMATPISATTVLSTSRSAATTKSLANGKKRKLTAKQRAKAKRAKRKAARRVHRPRWL